MMVCMMGTQSQGNVFSLRLTRFRETLITNLRLGFRPSEIKFKVEILINPTRLRPSSMTLYFCTLLPLIGNISCPVIPWSLSSPVKCRERVVCWCRTGDRPHPSRYGTPLHRVSSTSLPCLHLDSKQPVNCTRSWTGI